MQARPEERSISPGAALTGSWPLILAVAFFALLPFRREMEFPLSIFAVSLAFLAANAARRVEIRAASKFLLPLFLVIWIPMMVSCLDSIDPHKSWINTIPALRFLAAALAIAVLMRKAELRDLFLRLVAWLLLIWAADGYVQLVFGRDLFGVPMHEDRLNALFYSRYQFYGPTLAFLSPLALDHMRRHWPKGLWMLGFAFILGAVLISGMRSAWLMMALVMVAFLVPALSDPARRRRALILPAAAIITLGLAILASPLLQERLKVSSVALLGTEAALDEASSYRLPVFANALAMYRDHPINGVGVRAYGIAYPDYAQADDPHMLMYSGDTYGLHAHNIVLEFMADTGTIGLLGLLVAYLLAIRYWRGLDGFRRAQAFPYAVSLLVIVFPFNSFFSHFGVYTSSVTWVLLGLMCAAGMADAGEPRSLGASGNAHERTQVGDGDDGHRDDEENADDGLGHGV